MVVTLRSFYLQIKQLRDAKKNKLGVICKPTQPTLHQENNTTEPSFREAAHVPERLALANLRTDYAIKASQLACSAQSKHVRNEEDLHKHEDK